MPRSIKVMVAVLDQGLRVLVVVLRQSKKALDLRFKLGAGQLA
jgi:hypothetical protein